MRRMFFRTLFRRIMVIVRIAFRGGHSRMFGDELNEKERLEYGIVVVREN